MKQTRENIIEESAEIRTKYEELSMSDQERRKEFAKAFSWYKKRGQYDYLDEIRIPTWTEVFIEIGKLLVKQKQLTYVADVEELKLKVRETALTVEEINQRKV